MLELADERLPGAWGLFELDVDALVERVPELIVYEDVITFPALKQDLAFAVPESVTAAELIAAARAAAGPELREMKAFDVYRGSRRGRGGSRSPSECRSSRRSGRSRMKTQRRCGSGSSPRSRRSTTPSCALKTVSRNAA